MYYQLNEKLADKIISKEGKADIFYQQMLCVISPTINDVVCGDKKLIKKKALLFLKIPTLEIL